MCRANSYTFCFNAVPLGQAVKNHVVKEIVMQDKKKNHLTIKAKYFLDATDLGDLLPLTQTDYVTGAESQADTGEPNAQG